MLSAGWLPCPVQSQVEPAASSLLELCQPEHGQRPCLSWGARAPVAESCALRGLRCGVQPSSDISLFFSQVLALCLQLCSQPLKLHWLHKVRDWGCREMVPALAALAPWEAATSLLGLRTAAVTPLSGCVSLLSWAAAVSPPATPLWDGNIPLAQSVGYRAQLQTQMGEVGSQDLQGLRRKG